MNKVIPGINIILDKSRLNIHLNVKWILEWQHKIFIMSF